MFGFITSLFDGMQKRSAIDNASKEMLTANDAAGDLYSQGIQDANNTLTTANLSAIARVLGVSEEVAAQLLGVSESAAAGVDTATRSAVDGVYSARDNANAGLQPYVDGGTQAFTSLRELSQRKPNEIDVKKDPGYQFRLDESLKAMEASAAARGGALGGAAIKEATQYASNYASDEYGKAWARDRADLDRERAGLTSLATIGLNAAGQVSHNTMQAGTVAGGYGITGANNAGQMRVRGAETSGTIRMNAANTASGYEWQNGQIQSGNRLSLAEMRSDQALRRGQINADRHTGRAATWSNTLNKVGETADAFVSGGLSGGTKGFSWRRGARAAGGGFVV